MAMDSAPETPKPETPKLKRHYAVTEKAREARRLSLAKAREKAKLALRGYRRGPQEDEVAYQARLTRQIKPWCANLRHGIAAKKADRSAHYASQFTHGLSAPDLDRSAAAAGESREELRRHIERCQRVIGGLAGVSIDNRQSPTVNRQSKLVLALAYVFWRALRLMRTQVRWERRALAFRLQELAGWRARHPELTPERLNQFRGDLDSVTGNVAIAWGHLESLRKRFEALFTALFDPERWERLADHIRAPSRFPNEAMYLAKSGGGLASWLGLGNVLSQGGGGAARRRRGPAAHDDAPGADLEPEAERESPAPGLPRAPRNAFTLGQDVLERICRTRACGAQDWRLRLDRLAAETLGLPFQSPSHVERALERQAAPVQVSERRGSESESPRCPRSRSRGGRFPDDGLLGALSSVGVLAEINSLDMLRAMLAQGLGDAELPVARTSGSCPQDPAEVRELGERVTAVAEALWTRIEAARVLVETLEEMLTRMLEYHASLVVQPSQAARRQDACTTSFAPAVPPDFDAILELRKAALRARDPAQDAGLRLDDLWISTDPFPGNSPLDRFRQWFEAADGVLDAGSRLAQNVDVALYEFAVRRFGLRRDFVAWRPELSINQWRERQGRPEWAPRVMTVDGGTALKVDDEEVYERADS